MEVARITSKGQMTIPKKVREAARLREGDLVTLAVEGDSVRLRRIATGADAYLKAVEGTLGEWTSPEDEDAWRAL